MKQKSNSHEGLQPNGASKQPPSSDNSKNHGPSGPPKKSNPVLSGPSVGFPENLLQIVRQAGINVKRQGAGSRGQGEWKKGRVEEEMGARRREMREGKKEMGDRRRVKAEKEEWGMEMGEGKAVKAGAKDRKAADSVILPTLPDSIFPTLPKILQKVVTSASSKEERDLMLLGSLVSFGACLPKFHGYYDGMKVFPHLYLFITAQASAGKGHLALCKHLVMPVHLLLRQEAKRLKDQYDHDLEIYNKMKSKNSGIKKPAKPPELMLIIPANNSATGMFQLLHENGGRGLIFETEGDTLAQAFRADPRFSDGFRKGFQHEAITYYRRTEREFAEILCSCIAAVLSGTPNQVASLIPSAENGLLSRFLFYHMNIRPVWKDVFAANGHKKLEEHFDQLGQEFLPFYKTLTEYPEIEFSLSQAQQQQFNAFFGQIQDKYLTLQGMDYMATIRRLGLIAFRIAMTLTALRLSETKDFSEQQVCAEVDFQTALSMVNILVKHSSHVFSELERNTKSVQPKEKMEQFLEQLPQRFNRAELLDLAKSLFIGERTAYTYITTFCEKGLIFRELQGTYTKINGAGDLGD